MSQSKNYNGKYMAEVVSVADPEKRCRVKVNVYDVFDGVPIASLPFANFQLPLGSRSGEGAINPLKVGDKVWVEFVGGDSRRPLITGAAQAAPGGTVNLPPDVRQGEGAFQHKRTEEQGDAEEAPYYEDVVYCQNRALIQLCRSGTIRVTQMDSGSAIEIKANGDMIVHCEGNMFTSVEGNTLEEYNGDLEQRIKGDFKQTVTGTMSQTSVGDASYGSSDSSLSLSAAAQGTLSGGGGLKLEGPTDVVNDITCYSSITASGNIIAGGANVNHHGH